MDLREKIFIKLLFLYMWPASFLYERVFKGANSSGALGLYVIVALVLPPIFWISWLIIAIFCASHLVF